MDGPILIVDDEADARTFVRAVLEADGHAVAEAGNAEEALAQLERTRPSLVLLDVVMPGTDGFAVAESIKRHPGAFIPVILLTGLDDPGARARGIAVGADDVLQKPVHPFELRLRIRAMLRIATLAHELHLANRRLSELARTDELTGVLNRRGLKAALEREHRRAERYGSPLSVATFDIDHFKSVNDRFGHAAGDRVLAAVASALSSGLRGVDVVGRSGGEEFIVVMPETGAREAAGVAERLRQTVARVAVSLGDQTISVTVSGGVATFSRARRRGAEDLLAAADHALYRAKSLGRDRVQNEGDEDANQLPR